MLHYTVLHHAALHHYYYITNNSSVLTPRAMPSLHSTPTPDGDTNDLGALLGADDKPEEKPKKKARRAKKSKRKTKKKDRNPCPHGHVFGVDFEEHEQCEEHDCSAYDDCFDEYEKIN